MIAAAKLNICDSLTSRGWANSQWRRKTDETRTRVCWIFEKGQLGTRCSLLRRHSFHEQQAAHQTLFLAKSTLPLFHRIWNAPKVCHQRPQQKNFWSKTTRIYFEHFDPEQEVLPSWYLPIMHTSNLIRSSTYPPFVMLTRFEKCTLCSLRNLATILLWPRGGGGGTQYIHYKSATSHCSGEQ